MEYLWIFYLSLFRSEVDVCSGTPVETRCIFFLRSVQTKLCDRGGSYFSFFDLGNLCYAAREEDTYGGGSLTCLLPILGIICFVDFVRFCSQTFEEQ